MFTKSEPRDFGAEDRADIGRHLWLRSARNSAELDQAKRLGRPVELPELRLKHLPPDWTLGEESLLDLLRRRFGTLGGDQPL